MTEGRVDERETKSAMVDSSFKRSGRKIKKGREETKLVSRITKRNCWGEELHVYNSRKSILSMGKTRYT